MFVRNKWSPVFAPETETGTDAGTEDRGAPPIGTEEHDGPGSGRSPLRKELEKNFEADRKVESTERTRTDKGQFTRARARLGDDKGDIDAEEGKEVDAKEGAEEDKVEGQEQEVDTTAKPAKPAPEGWSKEAKAEWAKLPAAVQTAVSKREQDVSRGVEQLKANYAEIDQALGPRLEMIRHHGHTPGQAVNQLFAWFEALSANPDAAFPALAQSFKYDLKRVAQPGQAAETDKTKTAGADQPEGDVPPAVQKYINEMQQKMQALEGGMNQRFGDLQNTFAQQSQAKTEEILSNWSKDKPHFESVRGLMAQLIASGAVPLKEGGKVDLDGAYDMALYANPEVRTQILADQQAAAEKARQAKLAAEKKAQQDQAEKARRAGGGLAPGAPGAAAAAQAQSKKGKSVRESIQEARQQLSEQA